MKIDCSGCQMYQTAHCEDCLVTAMLHPPEGIVEIDENLDPSLQALSGAGLIPILRFRPRSEKAEELRKATEGGIASAG